MKPTAITIALRLMAIAGSALNAFHRVDSRGTWPAWLGLFCALPDRAKRVDGSQRQPRHALVPVPTRGSRRVRCGTLLVEDAGRSSGSGRRLPLDTRPTARRDAVHSQRPVLVRAQGRAGRLPHLGLQLSRCGTGRRRDVPQPPDDTLSPAER